jgi:hypothetical protein
MPARKRGKSSATRDATRTRHADRETARIVARATRPPLVNISDLIGSVVESPAFVLPRVPVRRPDDLLVGTLSWRNLTLVTAGGARLERTSASLTPVLQLELPPQSFGEEALLDATGPEVNPGSPPFPESGAGTAPTNTPSMSAQAIPSAPGIRIRMAGPSRIVVRMPDGVSSIPYTHAAMLEAIRTWPMVRMAVAAPEPVFILRSGATASLPPAFLRDIVSSHEVAEITTALQRAVSPVALRTLNAHLARVAAQVADAANTALRVTGDEATRASETVATLIRQSVDQIVTRLPELNQPSLRALATAAVSAHSLGALLAQPVDETLLGPAIARLPNLNLFLRPTRPWNFVTALELPYRLMTSPIDAARWRHATQPVEHSGRTELWHTRLSSEFGPPGNTGRDTGGKIRAVWSDDYALPTAEQVAYTDGNLPFRMPTDPTDRAMLVKLMAGFDEERANGAPFRPRAARVDRLALSALGALLDAEGNWALRPVNVDLEQWRHRATLGRDHYVRVVYAGFLWPFGHAASLIKVTERKFEPRDPGQPFVNRVAILRQRFFIVVREHEKAYDGSLHLRRGHCFPFTSVALVTNETPSLVDPTNGACRVTPAATWAQIKAQGVLDRMCFWPLLATGPTREFMFSLKAIDRAGDSVAFSMPLLFVGETANQKISPVDVPALIRTAYDDAPLPRRTAQIGGSSVCFAPPAPGALGDPRLPTRSVTFRAGAPASNSTERVNVYPEVAEADCGIRALQRVLGRQDATVRVRYPATYTDGGFDGNNPGEVFLELVNPFALTFGNADKNDSLGALASPAMDIAGLSRIMGPAADIAKITGASGALPSFDPMAFFKDAKILGGIPLSSLLQVVSGIAGGNVPKFLTRDLPDRVEGRFDWDTRITKSDPLKLFQPDAGGEQTKLVMHAVMSAPIANPTASTFKADATLNDFKVDLFGFLILWFTKLQFIAQSGQKPDVVCDMHPDDAVVFGGPLEFVNELKDLIPGDGFTDPPTLNVTPTGISAGFSLTLPSIQVGVFALSNASLGAAFSLPFDSRPVEVKFNFCTRERPFSLTVSFLGGGGFFLIGLGTDGVREIEASIEFGAGIAIDLGVASGSVEIKAGVYFHWLVASPGGVVELTGFVRLHGELTVLGLISASLTFNLQLGYRKEGSSSYAFGEATLTVEIDLFIFSASVSVRCYREFGGSASDPTVLDLLPQASLWDEYCLAYAAE